MRLQRRHAGDVHKQPIDEERANKGEGPMEVRGRDADRNEWVGAPAEPFEKIIGMARQAPEADLAKAAAIGGVGSETRQLSVRDSFADNRDDQDDPADPVA